MRKILFNIFALGALLLTASCSLHDDEELFDTPAAQRVEESIANDKALLESATNGWELHLWLGEDNGAGATTYFMKFQNDKVTVSGDIADPTMTATSSYDVIADEGPVLTFNTYNTIFHYLANPQADGSQMQQDYEFVITRTTNDSIYLRGKKYGNNMVMTRVADDVSWADEITKMQAVENDLMLTFVLRNGTDSVGTAELDNDNRVMEVNANDSTYDIPYYISTDGIVLLNPLNVKGVDVQNLVYNSESMSLTSKDNGASSVLFQVNLPDNYMYYNEFAGNWRLRAGDGSSFNITLTPAGDGSSFTVTGFGDGITVTMNYIKSTGSLQWLPQVVGHTSTGNDVYALGWALDPSTGSGSIYYSLAYGFSLNRDLSQDGTVLTFSDISGGMGITSFYLVETTGVPSNSTWVGSGPDGFYFTNTAGRSRSYIAYLADYGTMTKVE